MGRMNLELSTIPEFSAGKPAVAFKQGMRRAVADMLDNPGEKAERVVTLELHMSPVTDQSGDVSYAQVGFVVKTKLPHKTVAPMPCALTKAGLIFNPDAPDNPAQRTLDEVEEEG